MSGQPAPSAESGQLAWTTPDNSLLSGVVSAREAAATLGVNERTIRRAIQRGELVAIKHGRSFQITSEALARYRSWHDPPSIHRPPPQRLVSNGVVLDPTPGGSPQLVPFIARERVGATVLPAPLTLFVGREREVAEVAALLRRDDVRCVTLTGTGGVGKTRLALRVASDVASSFTDGAVFVALAPIQHPDLVLSAIAQALGVRESETLPLAKRLTTFLGDRQLLLILDNFEHVTAAGPLVADLLSSCSGLTILVTSRTLLHISGERAFIVPVLELPERRERLGGEHTLPPLDELSQVEAIRLFVDRAQAARADFALTPENATAVVAICERLDSLPLAIELAAARCAVLSPAALLARLERRLQLLTSRAVDQPARLRTMRDAIAWSHDLLIPEEQSVFRRLAAFTGGFTLEAAEAVAGGDVSRGEAVPVGAADDGSNGFPSRSSVPSVLDLVTALVDSSLVQRGEQPDGESRFGLLETVREFALEQLIASGEEAVTRSAHAAYYLDLVERAQNGMAAMQEPMHDRFALEHDNLRGALDWTIARGEEEAALRLAGGLWMYWYNRGFWAEGRSWLERALHCGTGAPSEARVAALIGAGTIAGDRGDFEEGRRLLDEGLALSERLGYTIGVARALRNLGIIASNQSDLDRAAALFEQSLVRFRAAGDQTGIARCLGDLGLVASRRGDKDRAIAFEEQALLVARDAGDQFYTCVLLGNLGEAYVDRGEYARGEALCEEALALARGLGDTFGVAVNLYSLGNCAFQLGNVAAAIERYRETLPLARELEERPLASRVLDRFAITLLALGQPRLATRLFGAASALREAIDDQLFADEQAFIGEQQQVARERLGEHGFAQAWAAGRAMSFEQAMAEAMAVDPPRAATSIPRLVPDVGLTPREVDVLRLLIEGRSDKEIAAALFISRPTASKHVTAILGKLGVSSRTAAAAIAVRDHLT